MTLARGLDPIDHPSLTSRANQTCPGACELTVVVPTYNERDNVAPLVERLRDTLASVEWRVIFVDDDSPDGTAGAVKALSASDARVTCLRRVGRRGLAGAVVEGVMASASPFVAVIDADMQHDERLLSPMLTLLRGGQADLVIGSRYLHGDGPTHGLSAGRKFASRLANWLARKVLAAEVSDPVSGFFMIRRQLVERVAPRLSRQGFKILFDIIASQPAPPRIVELPYAFRERQAGTSKLDGRVVVEYLGLILARLTGDLIPARALLFALVGASGVIVQLAAQRAAMALGAHFDPAQLAGAVTAMTSNFLINNAVTYRDRRLAGPALVTGYLRFCGLCALGLVANVAVGDLIHRFMPLWWVAGVGGALAGAAWNYVSTAAAVW